MIALWEPFNGYLYTVYSIVLHGVLLPFEYKEMTLCDQLQELCVIVYVCMCMCECVCERGL